MIRQYKLVNAGAEVIDLMDESTFFGDTNGLGVSRTIETVTSGFCFIPVKNELDRQNISGTLYFAGYDNYLTFARFCSKVPLKLYYNTTGTWAHRIVLLQKLEKPEIDKTTSKLLCPVEFMPKSAWRSESTVFAAAGSTASGKVYPYTYPFAYREVSAGAVALTNNGWNDAQCRLHIMGPVASPTWSLVHNSVTLLTGNITATITEGHKLVVDADPLNLEIAEYTTDNVFVQNLYAVSDFDTERFISIPPGDSTLYISHQGAQEIEAYVEVIEIAETM